MAGCGQSTSQPAAALVPTIGGNWWQVAGQPDLGVYNSPQQQPVDFAIWQAGDGTWQLQSCIRNTLCGGNTRLFYRWEGQQLSDTNWTPVGIAMQADPTVGETPGGLQAPYVMKIGSTWHMFYGDWQHICHAVSSDGKAFTRVIDNGGSAIFSEGTGAGTRDPMVLPIGGTYYAYYTAEPTGVGEDFLRTSSDLVNWTGSQVVARGGSAGTSVASSECPFVAQPVPGGSYFLFRTQHYGLTAQTSVYRSNDPTNFGLDTDADLVGRLPVAAPEIFQYGGQWYIAALLPSLQGIQIARLAWVPAPSAPTDAATDF
jgi:hypothetical protein